MTKEFNYLISGSASELYPVETFFGLLYISKNEVLEIPKCYPFSGEWGYPLSKHLMDKEYYPVPQYIDVIYLSVIEEKFYSIETHFSADILLSIWNNDKNSNRIVNDKYIVVGMAPYGGVAVWGYEEKKSIILCWKQATEVAVTMKDFSPLTPNVSLSDYCASYLSNKRIKENLTMIGLPPRNLYNKYMQQFTYRYQYFFEHWNEDKEEWKEYEGEEKLKMMPEFDYIEEALFDGTHDKLHDGGLMSYHDAGKPKKIAIAWRIKKSEYTAYFWFGEDEIQTFFDRFYGAHPETKTDFMIRIDSEKKKIELALYRYGLKEPQVISESAYQLLVFKNKFEYYRSDNYNQAKGAWIW